MKTNNEKICYEMLTEVLVKDAYANIVCGTRLNDLPSTCDRAYITRLFYGVLEKNTYLEYVITRLVTKKPQASVGVLLKIGLYMLRFMDIPAYAAVDKTVELCKNVGKAGVSGFVNAVLKQSEKAGLPDKTNKPLFMSVVYSYPQWIVEKLIEEYGEEADKILAAELPVPTHIRFNRLMGNERRFAETVEGCSRSALGYYVSGEVIARLEPKDYCVQSLASMLAARAYASALDKESKVLDLCAAPGGKAIYLYELTGADIVACDIHPHRLQLMKKYAAKAGARLETQLNDALLFRKEWCDAFDAVVCDVPCSGLGVVSSKPDILIKMRPEDIAELNKLQWRILAAACRYVKPGGSLFYSTCTLFKSENEDMIERFLSRYPFELAPVKDDYIKTNGGMIKLLPYIDGTDGFFIASMRRKK